jgi:hypothetical protein
MPAPEISVHEARDQAKLLAGAYVVTYPEPGDSPQYLVVREYGRDDENYPNKPEPAEMRFLTAFGWEKTAEGHYRRVVG